MTKSPSSPLLPGTGTISVKKLEILVILTYLKEKLKYCLKKCLFISVGVIEIKSQR
jgi:hypothetical protein